MEIVFILVNADEALMIWEESVDEGSADRQADIRSDLFIFMKGDDVMGIHSSGILIPDLFLFQERTVHAFRIDNGWTVWTSDINITFSDFLILKNIFDDILHRSMGLGRVIDDLIDCHISSLSFRK